MQFQTENSAPMADFSSPDRKVGVVAPDTVKRFGVYILYCTVVDVSVSSTGTENEGWGGVSIGLTNALKIHDDFASLPEIYIIFITERDVLQKGLPLYHIDRYIGETETLFDDWEHFLFVNGECRDASSLGRLMHDFSARIPMICIMRRFTSGRGVSWRTRRGSGATLKITVAFSKFT